MPLTLANGPTPVCSFNGSAKYEEQSSESEEVPVDTGSEDEAASEDPAEDLEGDVAPPEEGAEPEAPEERSAENTSRLLSQQGKIAIKEKKDELASYYTETTCGRVNEKTKSIEKGDCSVGDNGKVITEITEVIGPEITADSEGNEIIDVYQGTCCFITDGDDVNNCIEERFIYTETFEDCQNHPAKNCNRRQWIIGTSGAGIIKIFVKQFYNWAAGTIGFVSVITIVISGIQISVSGVSGDISSARERILKALGALVLLFLSSLLLFTINPTFFS